MLTVSDLYVQLDKLVLADNMSFRLNKGEINVIIGPNGTGKSTLLKTLFGDIRAQGGTIQFDQNFLEHKKLDLWRRDIGYMPQDIRLDVGLTALEVVLLGRLDALSYRIDESLMYEAINALSELGLEHLASQDVRTLSGGQCQMILFAQALMKKPAFLMLDEPVSALDLHFQQVLLSHLVKNTAHHQWIALMVLHDLNLAAQYADNLIVLKEGKVVACGKPVDVLTKELIEDVYGVQAQVSYDAEGIPFVRTLRAA
ncbi:ABC transporter ATP-binding protein [Vibrio sp.]|nr:ABC transporter ATP-binding protein [Vibrio sp.]